VTVTPATFGTDQVSRFYFFNWSGTQSLTGSTTYWVKIYSSAADSSGNCWQVGTEISNPGTTKSSSDNSSWSAALDGLYYRVVDQEVERQTALFYEYKGALYAAYATTGSGAPEVYINGDRGAADSNSGDQTKLNDATKSWTPDEWIGSVVKITAGPGFTDEPNWRVIVDNDSTSLTVNGTESWVTTHTTATEYVIVASDKWTELTSTGLTGTITDILASSGVVYFALGESTNIRRHREYNNAGTWTNSDWADDGTNKATFLTPGQDPVGGWQIWRANTPEAGSSQTVSRASFVGWGTNLTFGTAIPVGSYNERINGLEVYGAPLTTWVFKEGSVWTIVDDIAVPLPLREMAYVRSTDNGKAHVVNNVYLYFSLLTSVQEYYRAEMRDMGPTVDAGLPSGRQGVVAHLLGYPGQIIACVDGGSTAGIPGTGSVSSVLRWRNDGWHEEYRAPVAGKRIRRAHIQVIPGSSVDRLWVAEGMDILWLPVPSVTFDPYRDAAFLFTHEGTITSSWHYANLQDVQKLFNSLKVFAENVAADASGGQVIEAEYQIDDAGDTSAWTPINGTFDTAPMEEVSITSDNSATGRRIRYRLRLQTSDNAQTPRVKATVVEVVSRPAVKYSYTFRFRAQDENLDLEGDDDTYAAAETLTSQMETWANAPTVLTMRSVFSPYDNKKVLLDPAKLQPRLLSPDDQTEQHIGEATVFEI